MTLMEIFYYECGLADGSINGDVLQDLHPEVYFFMGQAIGTRVRWESTLRK